jgi:hypothetical protein
MRLCKVYIVGIWIQPLVVFPRSNPSSYVEIALTLVFVSWPNPSSALSFPPCGNRRIHLKDTYAKASPEAFIGVRETKLHDILLYIFKTLI